MILSKCFVRLSMIGKVDGQAVLLPFIWNEDSEHKGVCMFYCKFCTFCRVWNHGDHLEYLWIDDIQLLIVLQQQDINSLQGINWNHFRLLSL